jgi:hypothetical protein
VRRRIGPPEPAGLCFALWQRVAVRGILAGGGAGEVSAEYPVDRQEKLGQQQHHRPLERIVGAARADGALRIAQDAGETLGRGGGRWVGHRRVLVEMTGGGQLE